VLRNSSDTVVFWQHADPYRKQRLEYIGFGHCLLPSARAVHTVTTVCVHKLGSAAAASTKKQFISAIHQSTDKLCACILQPRWQLLQEKYSYAVARRVLGCTPGAGSKSAPKLLLHQLQHTDAPQVKQHCLHIRCHMRRIYRTLAMHRQQSALCIVVHLNYRQAYNCWQATASRAWQSTAAQHCNVLKRRLCIVNSTADKRCQRTSMQNVFRSYVEGPHTNNGRELRAGTCTRCDAATAGCSTIEPFVKSCDTIACTLYLYHMRYDGHTSKQQQLSCSACSCGRRACAL
jgi:hypothetical protein